MKTDKERIHELVIKAGDIDGNYGWGIAGNENLVVCPDCMGVLHYIKIEWGVVVDESEFMVMWNRGKRTYALREIGFSLYCAKCGRFIENYEKFFYPEDKLITDIEILDELSEEDRAEIWNCLNQFNQKGNFTPRYKATVFENLKKKLLEYEKKHPLPKKKQEKRKLRSKKK